VLAHSLGATLESYPANRVERLWCVTSRISRPRYSCTRTGTSRNNRRARCCTEERT
jgi:hypothetical protein